MEFTDTWTCIVYTPCKMIKKKHQNLFILLIMINDLLFWVCAISKCLITIYFQREGRQQDEDKSKFYNSKTTAKQHVKIEHQSYRMKVP